MSLIIGFSSLSCRPPVSRIDSALGSQASWLIVCFGSSWAHPSPVVSPVALWPPLFFLFTTVLQDEIVECVQHFTHAVDVKISANISITGRREALQQTLHNIGEWALRWKLLVSSTESATAHIRHNYKHEYTLLDDAIPIIDNIRDLGVIFTPTMRPEAHVYTAISGASRVANFVLRACSCRNPFVYIQARKVLVLPSLLYGSGIWRPWLRGSILALERFHRSFVPRIASRS